MSQTISMIPEPLQFAVRPDVIRQAIHRYRGWIEAQLGVPVSEAAILKSDLCLVQAAITPVLHCPNEGDRDAVLVKRLRMHIASVEIPSGSAPLIELHPDGTHADQSLKSSHLRCYALDWLDLPVALHLYGMDAPIIAMNVSYFAGCQHASETIERLVIARRTSMPAVLTLLESLAVSDRVPRLHIGNSLPQRITPCSWDDLVLDSSIVDLLKNDFESFFDREDWFREMRLPFRRGYLLHGPPGCGKSTAIRAMMSSRSLSAHTLRLFDPNVDAVRTRPSMIILEDLDRAFPRTGERMSKISMQQLLNSLDGVASGEGIVVVATANEPTILDPAILRRPGRFDRVVHFPAPACELRSAYFLKLNPCLTTDALHEIVIESEGFSFALLREAYVIAGQHSFLQKRQITADDLLTGIRALRRSFSDATTHKGAAGFRTKGLQELPA